MRIHFVFLGILLRLIVIIVLKVIKNFKDGENRFRKLF